MTTQANPPVVLLTGASTGLGLTLARLLRSSDHRLVLTARASSLPRLAAAGFADSDRIRVRALDVTNDAERRRVVGEADSEWGGVDILINNAGIAYRTVVEHFSEEGCRDQMEVNFRGPMELIKLVLPRMREKRAGRIINVSSVGGMMAMPTMSLYSASKFALEGATEALWYEVRPWNIKVTLVQPGFIHSDSFRNTRYTASSREALTHAHDPYHAHYEHMTAFISKLMSETIATPETVARRIVQVMRRSDPPLRLRATFDASLFTWLRRLLPRGVYHALLYRKLPGINRWG